MRVANVALDRVPGRLVPVMQDVPMFAKNKDGTLYMGVFDGHNPRGEEIALKAALATVGVAKNAAGRGDALDKARVLRSRFRSLHSRLDSAKYPQAGTTASVPIFQTDQIAVPF